MGNHAKRKLLAEKLKEHGFGKLYKGNKRLAYKFLRARSLDDMCEYLNISPGDIVHDCSGFNHIVKNHLPGKRKIKLWLGYGVGWVFSMSQVEFTDGRYSCGCSPPAPRASREQIEECMARYVNDEQTKQWANTPRMNEIKRLLGSGKHITDKHGRLLPKLAKLKNEL